MDNQAILKVEQLTKKFTGMVAVDHVDIQINKNEVLALIGENGAGKSTLCKMLTGVYNVDEGSIYINDEKKEFKSPADSMSAGISMVYQERNLVSFLTAAQNVSLGYEMLDKGLINEKAIMRKAEEIKEQLGIDIPLDIPVEEMGAGAQQLVEIMRAFYEQPKVLILDEPTASLGEGEIEPFLQFIQDLKKKTDISIIYITHKLEEIFAIADKVTVLADGKVSMQADIQDVTQDDCVRAMIRSDKIKPVQVPNKDTDVLEKILEVECVVYDGHSYHTAFHTGLGEAVGFYGLVGSGRTETMEVLFGIRHADQRKFIFNKEEITKGDSFDMIQKGMVLTPEMRINGVFKSLNLIENVGCLFIEKFSKKFLGIYKGKEAKAFALDVLKKNGTKFNNVDQLIVELSGGNMQKVIIGRSVEVENLKLLILDEPTAGMDLGAKSEIYIKIRKLVDRDKKSVIFISSELDELMAVCDRMYIFHRGNVVKEFKRNEFNKEQILSYAIKGGAPDDK